ncbi:MAG: hypothetical protein EA365_04110 [Gloeocapsa sp. DLM2.Bin57]|nr:MAG: hypothetical protein EA365_04110 [Gloeocapsa sp. DLM2.Bin57]
MERQQDIYNQLLQFNHEQQINLDDGQLNHLWSLWTEVIPGEGDNEEKEYTSYDKDILLEVAQKYVGELESDAEKIREYIETRKITQESESTESKKRKSTRKPRGKSFTDLMSEYSIDFRKGCDLLAACGLPEKDTYTPKEVSKFAQGCELIREGKTIAEVAVHFGVASPQTDDTRRKLMEIIANQSSNQAYRIVEQIPEIVENQLEQVETAFNMMTYQKLRELQEKGEIDRLVEEMVQGRKSRSRDFLPVTALTELPPTELYQALPQVEED